MGRYGPDERPSIFSRPEIDEPPPESPSQRTFSPRSRPPADPPPPGPPRRRRRGLMIALAGAAVLILVVGGLVVGRMLTSEPDDRLGAIPSPTPSPSVSASASASPDPTPSPTATPSPTPEPTPAGPAQEVAVGGWASVAVDELSVRALGGTDGPSQAILVRGAVVHIAEGPIVADDLNWYRVASLGGTVGWVSSGWVAEPFLTTLVDDPTLIRCGDVGRRIFDVVDGTITPRDPIQVADLALPAAKFSDQALGTMELLRGVGEEVCFSAQLGSDGVPAVGTQLSVTACGHAVAVGQSYELRPAANQAAPIQTSIKDPALIHPALLVGGPPEARMSSNIASIVSMMAGDDAVGCFNAGVTEGLAGDHWYRSVNTSQCSVVTEYNADNLRLRPAVGGDPVWIKLTATGYQPGLFALNVPTSVAVSADVGKGGVPNAWAHPAGDPDCG